MHYIRSLSKYDIRTRHKTDPINYEPGIILRDARDHHVKPRAQHKVDSKFIENKVELLEQFQIFEVLKP